MRKIYFGARSLLLADATDALPPGLSAETVSPDSSAAIQERIDRFDRTGAEQLVLRLEKGGWAELLPLVFTVIRTGGGLVEAPGGAVLLIYRRGSWDLPKGWVERGETLEDCALREVLEETGLDGLRLQRPLPVTYHTYRDRSEKLILKENFWFLMQVKCTAPLRSQTEEEIERAEWVQRGNLAAYLQQAHPSIRDVFDYYRGT